MARSYRTQKESVIAARRAKRGTDGSPVLPRIIERKPAPGDIHPLSKRSIRYLLRMLPAEYLYGLSRIELRARQGPEIGRPFGWYWEDERAIVLYSLPTVWRLPGITRDFARSLRRFYADFKIEDGAVVVSWRADAIMGLWFYCDVVTHELGHHFAQQYEGKNGRLRGRRFEELIANLQAKRFTEKLFKDYKLRKSSANKTP
jgi:hypothetical protein